MATLYIIASYVQNSLDILLQIQSTNFSNTVDLEMLLESLYRTFTEFKSHEQIENKLIVRKLRSKMRMSSVNNSAVCNCHKVLSSCGFLYHRICVWHFFGVSCKHTVEREYLCWCVLPWYKLLHWISLTILVCLDFYCDRVCILELFCNSKKQFVYVYVAYIHLPLSNLLEEAQYKCPNELLNKWTLNMHGF